MRNITASAAAFAALLLVPGSPVDAQPRGGGNYSRGGQTSGQADLFGSVEEIPEEEELESALGAAPWKLGILRLQPWLGIRDARLVTDEGFTTGSSGAEGDGSSDVTVSAGAGLRGYVKLGESGVLAMHALPEYTWWADDDARSQVNGRYGVGLFQHHNRFRLEISARREERQSLFSSEVLDLVSTRTDVARIAGALRLGNRIEWVSSIDRTVSELDDEDGELGSTLRALDRETDTLRSELRWEGPYGWQVSLGAETATLSSEQEARDLSTDTFSILAGLGYTANRFEARLAVQQRELKPDQGSDLQEFDTTTGSLHLAFRFTERDLLGLYTSRNLLLSVSDGYGSITSDRTGASYTRTFPRWKRNEVQLELFGETGEDEFEPVLGSLDPLRTDDVTSWGAWLSMRIRKSTTLWFGGSQLDLDSEIDDFDRTYSSFGASIQIQFNLGQRDLLGRAPSAGRW